ncbi:MAG: hypothetical protein EOO65_03945 [Methanosarcinales archaeon]|nr:MAG: hypothetical protein EOO65_03945 [Methanosarcinales archaeon]
MYLQLAEKLSPRKVALALLPHLQADQVEWDHENIYEWAFVDLPELSFSLNVTRDHGMSHVDDEVLDTLSPEQIEALPIAGPTYIYGYDRRSNSHVLELPDELVQHISNSTGSDLLIYPGRLAIDNVILLAAELAWPLLVCFVVGQNFRASKHGQPRNSGHRDTPDRGRAARAGRV